MRFMMLLKADKRTEAGVMPTVEELERMGAYNEQLIKAGVMLDGAGLQATSKGAKVTFSNGKVHVVDGPFAETKEILAGYWIIKVKSKAEAIEWAKKIPFDCTPNDGRDPEVELRQMFDLEDFENIPESVAEQERQFEANRGGIKT